MIKEDTDFVINCAGIIRQIEDTDVHNLLRVNGVFPWRLQDRCEQVGAKLIHASTDCVFSGKRGSYTELDKPDAIDFYGLSKSLGEPRDAMIIRTSIIGREIKTSRSLLEWAISHTNETIDGYIDHFWNGITSRAYAKACVKIMIDGLWSPGIHHVFSTSVTKHDLLCKISNVYGLNLKVKPVKKHDVPVDMTLATMKSLCAFLAIPDIDTMLHELSNEEV
jgi:dTDP-4-dehydrorhamnose reductase